jgi:hypothetical protein
MRQNVWKKCWYTDMRRVFCQTKARILKCAELSRKTKEDIVKYAEYSGQTKADILECAEHSG